jgi:hypothetical protein
VSWKVKIENKSFVYQILHRSSRISLSIEAGFAAIHETLPQNWHEHKSEYQDIRQFMENCVKDTNILKEIRDPKNMTNGKFNNIE